MNIQSFYEYVILRDILAYMLPGGISLAGLMIIVQTFGSNRWSKLLSLHLDPNSPLFIIGLVLIAFLVGHVLDMVYRVLFQGRTWYFRPQAIRRVLTGSAIPFTDVNTDPMNQGIQEAVRQFFNLDWGKKSIEEWISSGKAYSASVLLGYWVECEDPKLFNTEIGRPVVQAHFLHASGLAFAFFGICIILSELVQRVGLAQSQPSDPIALPIAVSAVWLFAYLLIRQGGHKREIVIDHTFRAFYIVWRRRLTGNAR